VGGAPLPIGVAQAVAKGPELVVHLDNARRRQYDAVKANYKHVCVSTVKSRDQPGLMQVMGQTQHSMCPPQTR